jgi:uracil-DNA glycosylase
MMQCIPNTIESVSIPSSPDRSDKMQPVPVTPQQIDANEGEIASRSPLLDREIALMQELAQ